MAEFVIDEWLWADASGTMGRALQRQAYDVIVRLASSDHRIMVAEGSPFDRKAWGICKSTDLVAQAIARTYVVGLRQNSDRCVIVKPGDLRALPAELAAAINPDDHYLAQVQQLVSDAILVTTDHALRNTIVGAGLACLFRDEFVHTLFGG